MFKVTFLRGISQYLVGATRCVVQCWLGSFYGSFSLW